MRSVAPLKKWYDSEEDFDPNSPVIEGDEAGFDFVLDAMQRGTQDEWAQNEAGGKAAADGEKLAEDARFAEEQAQAAHPPPKLSAKRRKAAKLAQEAEEYRQREDARISKATGKGEGKAPRKAPKNRGSNQRHVRPVGAVLTGPGVLLSVGPPPPSSIMGTGETRAMTRGTRARTAKKKTTKKT